MTYRATFELDVFDDGSNPKDAELALRNVVHGCDFLLRCNVDYLLAYGFGSFPNVEALEKFGGKVPRFYDAGLRYQSPTDACGGDVWQDIPTLLKRGFGDCKDLACFRAAELIVFDKVDCKPVVRRKWLSGGFALYHVVIFKPGGEIEDPSPLLGMPSTL